MSVICSNSKSKHECAVLCSRPGVFLPHIKVLHPVKMQHKWFILSHLAGRELTGAIGAVRIAQQTHLSVHVKIRRAAITSFHT